MIIKDPFKCERNEKCCCRKCFLNADLRFKKINSISIKYSPVILRNFLNVFVCGSISTY